MTFKRKYKYVFQNKQMPRSSHYKALKTNKPINKQRRFYGLNFLKSGKETKISKNTISSTFSQIAIVRDHYQQTTPQNDLTLTQLKHMENGVDYDLMCTIEEDSLKKIDELEEEVELKDFAPSLIKELIKFETNELEIAAIILATFYAANLTQSAFSIVTELIKGLGSFEVPSTYDSCAQLILKHYSQSIKYEKTLFCKQCEKAVEMLNLNQQRFCSICKHK